MFTQLINKEYYCLYRYQLADYIKSILYTGDNRTRYHAMHSILDNIYRKIPNDIRGEVDIIYEVFRDDTGTKYGKELITGMIFPLYENTRFFEYFADLKDNRKKLWTTDLVDDLYILDQEDNQYLRNILYKRIKRQIIKRNNKYLIIYPCHGYGDPIEVPIIEANLEEYVLTAHAIFRNNDNCICESVIKEDRVASQDEVLEYKNKLENSVSYQNYICVLSNKNSLSETVKIKTRK